MLLSSRGKVGFKSEDKGGSLVKASRGSDCQWEMTIVNVLVDWSPKAVKFFNLVYGAKCN